MKKPLRVEVAYALPERQVLVALEVEEGSTVKDAVERSGILPQFPGINLAESKVGRFGKVVPLETRVRDGDRVEIYRPLKVDPRDGRRARAKKRG